MTQLKSQAAREARHFGFYLQGKRNERGYTLRGLARATRLSAPFLSNLERGIATGVSDGSLVIIAKELGLGRDEVFWMAGRLPPDLTELLMEAGPQTWRELRERFGLAPEAR